LVLPENRIVIAGGGFGGLYAALELEKILKRQNDISLTLLNNENFFLFTPMLAETAASSIGTRHIVSPLRKLLRRGHFAEVSIENIDPVSRVVSARHSLTDEPREFAYDRLILALGGVVNYFNIPGAAEHSIAFKTLGDAIYVRNHVIDKLEEAAVEPERATQLLTFAIVGGGLTGLEVSGALNDFVREALKFYPEIDRQQVRVNLIEAGPRLIPEMSKELATFAERILKERGVEVRTNTAVTRVDSNLFELSTGERLESGTIIWSAGVSPNPLLAKLAIPKERGRARVNEYLEVEGFEGLWAVGDSAYIFDSETGKAFPPTAQHAIREGKLAGHNVAASLGFGVRRPFRYRTMGQLALVGERTGVADLMGLQFSGFLAWFLWRTYYLMRIPLLEKRLRVMMDWTLDLFFERDIVQLAVSRERKLLAERMTDLRKTGS
jgi:NADH:quinone reductase (non-electrogenic)